MKGSDLPENQEMDLHGEQVLIFFQPIWHLEK